jgi:basic membrane lipoprotein Med (substrate-binding protein (PBP1-ABC) superfamily)
VRELIHVKYSRCLVAVAILSAISCTKVPSSGSFRVALLTPGPISDAGWNAGAYEGLLRIRDSLGAEISQVETKTPAEFEEAFRDYARRGYRLVFGHGFEFQDAVARVGAEYPGTVFITTSGSTVRPNVSPMVFQLEEGTYLAGMLAGGLTRSGKIGFVGGIKLPPVEGTYVGFAGGARAVRRGVEVLQAYIGNFEDVAAAKENALAQIRRGADVLIHNADAAAFGVFQAARENPGVLAIGSNRNQNAVAPDVIVASATLDVPHALLVVARTVKEGRFHPGVMPLGIRDSVVDFVLNERLAGRVSATLRARIAAARDSIVAGTLRVPHIEFGKGSAADGARD